MIKEYLNELYTKVNEGIAADDIKKIISDYVQKINQQLNSSEISKKRAKMIKDQTNAIYSFYLGNVLD